MCVENISPHKLSSIQSSKLLINPRSWTFWLLRILLSHTTDRPEIHRAISVFRAALFAITVTVLFLYVDTVNGQLLSAYVLAFFMLNFALVIVFLLKGKTNLSKYIFVISISSGHFLNAATQGRDAGNILLYFPFFCAIFLFFSFRKKTPIILLASYLTLQIIVLECSNFKLFEIGTVPTPLYIRINYSLLLLFSLLLCIQFIRELSLLNRATQAKLVLLNKRLKRKNCMLEKSNLELDTFVYKASHDMRSPLRSILGLVHLMRMETKPERMPEYFDFLEKSAKKLDAYVLEVLDISRNTKSEVTKTLIDLEPFVWDIYGKLKYMMLDRKIDFDLSIEGKEFYSDPSRLQLIISNLLGNSIKYSKEDKEIICPIQLRIVVGKENATFTFEDKGQGIDEEALPKIFDMFYRANTGSDGSGLGLYLVKETVTKLGGKINITSQLGIGTKVEVSLPSF